ncbi:LAMP family protein lmp-1-like [Arctopsyche grandis]|uniref:LAMP family protein lmp-1-like n=1 Tax=Arctopsyche grandis TaxID=121162 RepID=UPI00406D85B4
MCRTALLVLVAVAAVVAGPSGSQPPAVPVPAPAPAPAPVLPELAPASVSDVPAPAEQHVPPQIKTSTAIPTTPEPVTTTTVAPTTTTAVPPTTTTAPVTPVPPPEKGKWAYTEKNSSIACVIVQMAMQFNVTYADKEFKDQYAVFDLPNSNMTTVIKGSCDNTTQFITIQWPSSENNTYNNLTVSFMKNTTIDKYSLTHMKFELVLDPITFPNVSGNNSFELNYSDEMFTISSQRSYRCAKNQEIVLEPTSTNKNSTVSIKDFQVQAFATDKGTSFGYADDCDYVDVPDIVPIAVGCALGGLVLIVLIVYLVGRRNRQARGYLSM